MVETNQNAAEILKPGVRPLDFPSATIASKFPPILNFGSLIRPLRTDQIDLSFFLQALTKRKTICCPIVNQSRKAFSGTTPSLTGNSNGIKSIFYQRRFMGRCGSKLKPDRYALTICHHHKLCSLPAFGLSDAFTPFFAGENVPSAKTSSHLRRPFASNSESSFCQMSSQRPISCHSCIRRQHVLPEGKRSGISCHLAPVLRTQRIPSRQARFGARFCPPLVEARGLGRSGSRIVHCLFVSSLPTL